MRFDLASKRGRDKVSRVACLEVGLTWLRVAVVQTIGETSTIQVDELRWRERSRSLLSDLGVTELSEAMAELASRHDLKGCALRVALNGDLCVTRIATGSRQQVEEELNGFEDRCQRYLTLGHGQKIHTALLEGEGQHARSILAVANYNAVEAIRSGATAAGMNLEGVEPSIVSVSRFVGSQIECDEPVLLACLGGEGLEFGICLQGNAMAQFRPTKGYGPKQLAVAMTLHLPRLKRQCSRLLGSQQGDRTRLFLVGADPSIAEAKSNLEEAGTPLQGLAIETLNPERSHAVGERLDGRYIAALGLSMLRDDQPFGPNMLASIVPSRRPSLRGTLWRHRVAAVIAMIALGLHAAAWRTQLEVIQLREAHHGTEGVQGRIADVRRQSIQLKKQVERYQWLDAARQRERMWPLAGELAKCLPPEMWLTNLQADANGEVTFQGRSKYEGSIYATVGALRNSPVFRQVTINTTSASDSNGFVGFEMRGIRTEAGESSNEKE